MERALRTMVMVVAALLLLAYHVEAATMWEATSTITPSSPGKDITKVTVTDNATYFTFDMYLLGQPSTNDGNTQYNVYIGSTNTLPDNPINIINSNLFVTVLYSRMYRNFVSTLIDTTDPNAPLFKQLPLVKEFSGTTNKLEWRVSKTDLATIPYFMGATESGGIMVDRTNVAAAPIPASAWLLASGVLALIGLKRKMS